MDDGSRQLGRREDAPEEMEIGVYAVSDLYYVSEPDPKIVQLERRGLNDRFPEGNEEFCQRWAQLWWLPAVQLLRQIPGAVEAVKAWSPPTDHGKVVQVLFVQLLTAPDPDAELDEIVSELAGLRKAMGAGRYTLGPTYFGALADDDKVWDGLGAVTSKSLASPGKGRPGPTESTIKDEESVLSAWKDYRSKGRSQTFQSFIESDHFAGSVEELKRLIDRARGRRTRPNK